MDHEPPSQFGCIRTYARGTIPLTPCCGAPTGLSEAGVAGSPIARTGLLLRNGRER